MPGYERHTAFSRTIAFSLYVGFASMMGGDIEPEAGTVKEQEHAAFVRLASVLRDDLGE